jgi:indolepyruvate ferredoxin oxidoreductase
MADGTVLAPTPNAPTFISGLEALLQGILAQRRADQGRSTAGFISGYRGSPLGTFDTVLWNARTLLAASNVTFKPGLNEDLAATACWGTQQLDLASQRQYAGITAFWYGKGPGVDRSGDVFKHANMAGTSPSGGVVLLVGDDHGAKSSTLAHQSEQALAAAGIPVLYPSTIQEYVDYLPVAVELSRFASVWVAFKCVTETVESSTAVNLAGKARELTYPEIDRPTGGFHIGSGFAPLELENTLLNYRLPAARQFATANELDRVTWDSAGRALGIIAPGKSYIDVIEALRLLGITAGIAASLGLRIFKPLMVWPLAPDRAIEFCRSHREVLVVEEKRALIEEQLAGMLLRMPPADRPALSGKLDPVGRRLLPEHGELDALSIARAIGARLTALNIGDTALNTLWRSVTDSRVRTVSKENAAIARTPAFCSGCPHSRSTRLPEGSTAFGGIGCHGMALFVPELRTSAATHMGGEGANWIGLEDFVGTSHIFQNLGEGTYTHSGVLAIRAAVAAGSNITYKILHNGATAMTGGQPVEGEFSAEDIARQLLAERVRKVVLVTEDFERARNPSLEIEVYPRTELDRVQRQLRDIKGVTAVIYEQGCAAERRRLRKAGEFPDPPVRTYINPDICEGCGDCGQKSNCVSIVPIETELGRKRAIDQDSCNKDYTCIEGFCPSFVTVKGGKLNVGEISTDMVEAIGAELVDPSAQSPVVISNIVLAGIGGSGIVTLGRTIARAAMLEGWRVSTFDVTGLAQKNGPVYSHIRLFDAKTGGDYQPRIPASQIDVLIGCDIVGSAAPGVIQLLAPDRSRAFISREMVPVAAFQRNADVSLNTEPYAAALEQVLPRSRLAYIALSDGVRRKIGADALRNIVILGFAIQRGAIHIAPASLEKAMMRHGKADLKSIFALRVGRLLAQNPGRVDELLGSTDEKQAVPIADLPTDAAIARYREILTEYQNSAYADRYESLVRQIERRDPRGQLTKAAATHLFRLMRYKDEYEVARLYASPQFMERLRREFVGDIELNFNLAPPLLPLRRNEAGEPRKIKLGPWTQRLFRVLAGLKWLRGTPFDPFGWLADRRQERRLITEYCGWIDDLLGRLESIDYAAAIRIANLPERIRGYGPVKERNIAKTRADYALWREAL